MSLGSSQPALSALTSLTGEDSINAGAFLEYYQPLMDWLVKENAQYPSDPVGWTQGCHA
jgi:peptidyl-dipeptidase A